uniref:EF-hand domain-containing protein n=1 Tax=Chromera velia CCMP2878 TaxID=1169474 RepID=A0A0G4G7Q4_9ALVE|eukprot:Cvel_20565.t1-p1 / transcript=Cvel_20565.t1 / gene=Cvel_20565 / organism=Chromera_velia_CCMP2878 / gene_product=Isocitrate dehydrogenase [NADP], putative / transcript_product=Isocitrate dehydrogenase [NADP], putative / location=Cvel_scaffold1857:17475-18992(+) / protein_length=506 / sequence_SO=supercontig / SO=protein_coding / is_pseudo=false
MTAPTDKIKAPPMVYISGEEMTRHACQLMLDEWVCPFIDISDWEFFDLSCKARDESEDQVLKDAVKAGARIGAIFKEPTITPTASQAKEMGLKKAWGSPNGLMRRGWNGITISRDTIHIKGIKLGFKRPVLFERHAVGGEYGAAWKTTGPGKLETRFYSAKVPGKVECVEVDSRDLSDDHNVCVVYHNPLDNVKDLAHHFFSRCLAAEVVPYVVTKKTVFKWQEGFWSIMKTVFDEHYKEGFKKAGLLDKCGGDLQHLISDAATMQIIRWTDGGFGMAAHNYDGDMLTDEVAQVHRSPGFITSNLIGKASDGRTIKEFEASHGTVADLWYAHQRGEETSLNPLGLAEALMGAMEHAASLQTANQPEICDFVDRLRSSIHECFASGKGTRDLSGPTGLTTEQFIACVKDRIWKSHDLSKMDEKDPMEQMVQRRLSGDLPPIQPEPPTKDNIDREVLENMFNDFDLDGDGMLSRSEFERMVIKLGVAPMKGDKAENLLGGGYKFTRGN